VDEIENVAKMFGGEILDTSGRDEMRRFLGTLKTEEKKSNSIFKSEEEKEKFKQELMKFRKKEKGVAEMGEYKKYSFIQ
jgi:hypothetical protein